MRQTDTFRSGSSFLNSEFYVRSGAAALLRWAIIMKYTSLLLTVMLVCQGCNESKQEAESTSTGRVIQVESDDAGMVAAMQEARDSFDEFWAEVSADYERAIPALDSAMLKVYFADEAAPNDGEHLWVSDVNFDGSEISGVVDSEPLHLSYPKLGERVAFPLARLSDWLIVDDGRAKGAYTVQLLRGRMTESERTEHDSHYPFKFAPTK
jgi:uncharacterized protein YegJ (DUF2314 family)